MKRKRFHFREGFSLLEILVGLVILSILGLLIVQLVTVTTRATRMSNRGIDAAAQARLVFDRLGLDLAALVKRGDVDFRAAPLLVAGPPYGLQFFSEVTSPGIISSNNRGVSLVGYEINSSADSEIPRLRRGSVPLSWTGTGGQGITGYQTNGLPRPVDSLPVGLGASDFDVLAPAVIRTVIGFQLYPSGDSVRLASGEDVQAMGQIVYSPPVLFDASDAPSSQVDPFAISSLVVGVVAVDPEVMGQASGAQIAALASSFPLPSNGELPVAAWSALAEQPNSLPSQVPLNIRQSVRVFQRAFPLNSFGAL